MIGVSDWRPALICRMGLTVQNDAGGSEIGQHLPERAVIQADYRDTGFAIVPLFEPDEVARLRADVTDHIDRVARALHLPFETSQPQADFAEWLETIAQVDQSYANLLRVALCTDAHRGPRFTRLIEEGRLQARASEIAGVDLGDPVIRLRANVPALERHRQGWHSDVSLPNDDPCSRIRIACWLPLMDAGPVTGGLEIVVGMRDAPVPHDKDMEIPEAALAGMPRHAADCPMGSVVFLDRYTPHRAMPTTSKAARIALVVWLPVRMAAS
jgi:hypothetical protein